MRSISAGSLAVIGQSSDIAPIIIVKIFWAGSVSIDYCDKKYEQVGLVGKLLKISGIEDIVNVSASSSSTNMSIVLDDVDGSIKSIYNTRDIHKVYCQVLQWFEGLPLSDAFVIFEGEISSPIVWSEGERTLSFDIITKLEDREVGFSAEEGKFDFIPSSMIGKAWPIVFGRVAAVKGFSLIEPPTAVFSNGFGIVNDAIWDAEIAKDAESILLAHNNSAIEYQLSLNAAYKAAQYKGGAFFPDDPDQAIQWDNASRQHYVKANDYKFTELELLREQVEKIKQRDDQKDLEWPRRNVYITQTNLPSRDPLRLDIEFGNYTATVTIVNGALVAFDNITEKTNVNERFGTHEYTFGDTHNQYKRELRGQKFVWIEGGTVIKFQNFKRTYIVSIGNVTVMNVWGYGKFGRAAIPRNWYEVRQVGYGNLTTTQIWFPKPLSSYDGEWREDAIEIDCDSALSNNAVDIMRWAIQYFSSYGVDETSFAHVRTLVNPYKANFVLTERKNLVDFLQEVAFQSRCSIWINDRKFYIRFLPEELAPVDTITDSDVEVGTITVTATETERLVTKFTATWKALQNQSEPNKIIYRYNTAKYGTIEETYDFYIYNNVEYVAKAAEFWMIRKANTWKRISCKVLLHKLAIETFDPVSFSFNEPLVANGDITGIIEKSVYDADDNTLSIEAWLPVRLGEMSKYQFAFPYQVTTVYPVLDDPNIQTGNPYAEANGTIGPTTREIPVTYSIQQIPYQGNSYTQGRGEPIADNNNEATNFIVQLDPRELDFSRPLGLNTFNNEKRRDIKTPIDIPVDSTVVPNSFFGFIREKKNDNLYVCDMYAKGLFNDPSRQEVYIGYIRENTKLIDGFPIVIYRTIYTKIVGGVKTAFFEYWGQPAVWMPPDNGSALP